MPCNEVKRLIAFIARYAFPASNRKYFKDGAYIESELEEILAAARGLA